MSNHLNIHSKPPTKESCSAPSPLGKDFCIGSSGGPPSVLTGLTLNTTQENSSINVDGHTSMNINFTTKPQDFGSSENQRCQTIGKDSCEDLSFLLEKSLNHVATSASAQAKLSSSNEESWNQTFIPGLGDVDVAVPDKPASPPVYSRLINSAVNILRQFGLGKEDLDKLLSYPDDEINRNSLPSILEQIRNEKVNRLASPDQSRPQPPHSKGSSEGTSDSCGEPGQPETRCDKQDACFRAKALDHGHTSKNIGGTGEGKEMKSTTSDCASAGLMLKITRDASLRQETGAEKCPTITSVPNLMVTSQSDCSKQSPASSTMTFPVVSCAISNMPVFSVDSTLKALSADKVQSDFGSQSGNRPESCIQLQTVQLALVANENQNISHNQSPTNKCTQVAIVKQLMQQEDSPDQTSAQQKEELQQPKCYQQDRQEKQQPICNLLPQQPSKQVEEEQTKTVSQELQLQKLKPDMPPLVERPREIAEDQEMPKQKQDCQSTKCSHIASKSPVSKSIRESKYNPDTSQLKVTVTLPVLTKISCSSPPSPRNEECPQTKELVTPDPDSCEVTSKSDTNKDVDNTTSKNIQDSSDVQSRQHCLNKRDSKDKHGGRSQASSRRTSGSSLSEGNKNAKPSPSGRSHRSHASPDSPTPHRSHHCLDSKNERNSTASRCNPRERTSPGQCRGSEDWKEKRRTRSPGSPDKRSPSGCRRSVDRKEKRSTRSRSRSPLASRCTPRGAVRPVRTSSRRTASPLRSPQKKLPPLNLNDCRRSSSMTSRNHLPTSRSKKRHSLSSPSDETKSPAALTKQKKSSNHGGKMSAEQLAESVLEMPDVQALSDICDIDAVVKSLTPAVLAEWDELMDTCSPPIAGGEKAEPPSSPLSSSHCSSPDSTPQPVQNNEDSCERSNTEGNSALPEVQSSTVHQQEEEDRSASPSERPVTSSSPTWSNFCFKFFAADKMPIPEPKQNIPSNTGANKPSSPTMVRLGGVSPHITYEDVVLAMGCVGKTKSVLLIRCREEAVVCFEREEDAKKLKTFELKGCTITVKTKEVAPEDKRNSPDKRSLRANVHVLVGCAEQETSPDKTQPIKSVVVKVTSPPGASSTPKHQRPAGEMAADKVSDAMQHPEGQPEAALVQCQQSHDASLTSIESLKPAPACRARPVTTPEPASPPALTGEHAGKLNARPSPPALECADNNTSQPAIGVDQQECKPESVQLHSDLLRANAETEYLNPDPAATAKPETAPGPPSPAAPSATATTQAEKLDTCPSQTVQECTDVNRPHIGPASTAKPEKPEAPSLAAETVKQPGTSSVQDESKDADKLQISGINKQHQESKPTSAQIQPKQSQSDSLRKPKVEMKNLKRGPGSTAKTGTAPNPPSFSSPSAVAVKEADKLNKCPSQNVQTLANINKLQPQTGIAKPHPQCQTNSTQPQTPKSQIGSIVKPKLEKKNLKTGPAVPSTPPGAATLPKKRTAVPGSKRSQNVWECININEFQRKLELSCLRNLSGMSRETFISLNKRQLLITNLPKYYNGCYTESDIIDLIKPHLGRSFINVVCIMTEARMAVVIFQYAKYLYDVIRSSLTLRGLKLNLQILSVDTIASSPLIFFRYVIKQVHHTLVPDGSKTVYFSDISQSEIKELMKALESNTSVLNVVPLLNKLFIEFKTHQDSDQFGLWLHQQTQSFGTGVRRLQLPKHTPGKDAKISSRIPKGCDPPFQLTLSSRPYVFMTVTPTFCIPEYVSVNEVADIERAKRDDAKFQTVMLTGLPVKGYTFKDIVERVGKYFPKTSQHLLIHKVIVLPLQRRAFVHFDDWSSCYAFASSHMKTPMSVKGVKLYVHFVISDVFNPCNEEDMYTSMMELSNTPVKDPESLTRRLLYVWISQFSDEVFEGVLKMVTSMGPFLSILPLANRICFEMANASDVNKTPRYLPSQQFSMNPTHRVESLPSLKQRLQNSTEVEARGTLPPAVKQEAKRSLPDVPSPVSGSVQQASVQTAQSALCGVKIEASNPEINEVQKMADKTEMKVSVDSNQDERNKSTEQSEVGKDVLIPKPQDVTNNVAATLNTSDEPCKARIQEHQKETGEMFDSENKETPDPSQSLPEEKSEAQCTEISSSLKQSSPSDSRTKEADGAPQKGSLKVMEENSQCATSLKLLNQGLKGSPSQDVDNRPSCKTGGSCSKKKGDSTKLSKVLTADKDQVFNDQNSAASDSTPEMTGDDSPRQVIRLLENQTTDQQNTALVVEHEGSLLVSKEAEAAFDGQITALEEGKTLTASSKVCEGQSVQPLGDGAGVMDLGEEKPDVADLLTSSEELVCMNGERGLSSTEDSPTEQSSTLKGDEAENKSAATVAIKDNHINSASCEGQPLQNISTIQTPGRGSRRRARSTITRNLAKASESLHQDQEKVVSDSLAEDSTLHRVMITRSGRRKQANESISECLNKVATTVQRERVATRSHSLSPRSATLKKNSEVKEEVTSALFVNTNTENKLPVKRKRGRPKKVRMNQQESPLQQNVEVKTEELEDAANETPSKGQKKQRGQKDKEKSADSCIVNVNNIKTEVVNESYSEQSIGGSSTSVATPDSAVEEVKGVQADDLELRMVGGRDEKKAVMKEIMLEKSGDLCDPDPKADRKEQEPAQKLQTSMNDGGGQEQKKPKTFQTTKRQHKDDKVDAKPQSKPESKRFCPPRPSGAVVQLPQFNPDKPLGQEFIRPKTGYCCSLCAMFYISERTALEEHCRTQKHYDNLKAYYQKLQLIESNSSRKSPLKSTPDVNS